MKTNLKAFYFHYNKPESQKFGKNMLSVHYNNTCYIVEDIECLVPTSIGHRNNQPRCVVKGKCNKVDIQGRKAVIS